MSSLYQRRLLILGMQQTALLRHAESQYDTDLQNTRTTTRVSRVDFYRPGWNLIVHYSAIKASHVLLDIQLGA